MGMQPPQVVVNGVLNSLLKALFCRGSLTRVIVAAKIGDMNLTFGEWNDVISMYNIDFSTLSFGRKRKTPYGFEMDSGTLCVSKKGNLGDRKTFCISSEANGQSRHSKASLNINATHETSVPMCADLHVLIILITQDIFPVHQKAFVLSECPLQKKVAAKVNSSKKQQARANDQKICMVQTDVVKKAKEGSKGTMEWAKEKMKKGYEATKVRAVEGLEVEKENDDLVIGVLLGSDEVAQRKGLKRQKEAKTIKNQQETGKRQRVKSKSEKSARNHSRISPTQSKTEIKEVKSQITSQRAFSDKCAKFQGFI
ncbi:hypothetical protein Tco_0420723 [Tanacetum coccineum]